MEKFTEVNDTSVVEYKKSLLNYLKKENEAFSTHSMNEYELFLQGQKKMLEDIIFIIES